VVQCTWNSLFIYSRN